MSFGSYMLHASLPYPWPGMSHPGPDLLLHQRNDGQPAGAGQYQPSLMDHLSNHHTPPHQYTDTMCQPPVPQQLNSYHNFNSYPLTAGNPHAMARPVSRQSQDGNMRHASGGSQTSSHSATPPSPDDPRAIIYKHNQNLQVDRCARTSFDQGQCNTRDMQGASGLHAGSSPRTLQRMPPSPAPTMPQKSAFDLTTQMNLVGPNTSLYLAPAARSESVISTTVLMPHGRHTTYQPANVKQEPGSPAQYASLNPVNRTMKQEPSHPHSPQNMNATPPPGVSNKGYMERGMLNSGHTRPSFSYPSPQSSNPISPASTGESSHHQDPNFRFNANNGKGAVQMHSPGESTCNSAISSREGTPGPKLWSSEDLLGPAPNVDISRVQVKEEVIPKINYDSNDYTRRPSVNLSYPATPVRSTEGYSYSPTYHSLPQQVSLPPRPVNSGGQDRGGYRPSVGRPPIVIPGNREGGVPHSNVKIGRRPAHLPKVLKFEDHTLPHAWQRKLKQRKHGKQAGRWDVYIYSPCGVKFASRKKLKHFLEKNNLNYDAEQFDFTPYGKHIDNAPNRHLSSASSEGARHSPGAGHSPSGGLHPSCQTLPPEFLVPTSQPPAAHHSYMPPHPPYDFNPMMESPPNANVREIPPHNQILNLSHTPAFPVIRPGPPRSAARVNNFPSEIDDILNENADRNRLRDYSGHELSSRHAHLEEEGREEEGMREDTERGFMATSINILSDGNMDMNIDIYNNIYSSP